MVENLAGNGRSAMRRRAPAPKPTANVPSATPPSDDLCVALQRELAEQLVTLRAEFQEAVASYSVRVQGVLAQAGDLLVDESARPAEAEHKRRARLLRGALDDLGNLGLKPAKGRRRDLKVVEEFAANLSDEIAEW